MSVESIEAVAAPLIADAVKDLEPAAASLLKRFETYAEGERSKLILDISEFLNEHHAGLLGWLENALAKPPTVPAATPDPTSAPEAPTAAP